MHRHRPLRQLPVLAALALAGALPGRAEDLPQAHSPPAREPAAASAEATSDKAQRERELKDLQDTLAQSAETRRRLEAEIAELKTDRARLNAALIEATEKSQDSEDRLRATEGRLETMTGSEEAIRRSLQARRGLIVEVLAVLQRMGRRPPPAVLVSPEDMLAAVRATILLGAVLPELRSETEALAGDLAELVRLREGIAAERDARSREVAALAGERNRIAALIAARQDRLTQAELSSGSERERAAQLAGQAKSLRELVTRMEQELALGQRAAEEAKRAAEAQARETRERFAASAFRDPARLAPKSPFAETRGLLPRPASGEVLRGFGASDGYGGTSRGITIATRPRALVASPADGWIVFAGPFRSFGRLLIINAGGGYYLLLAGMDQISVELGQFVLAGEPVAVMGEGSSALPVAGAIETNAPALYVEFRKDGTSIDPGPWWAKSQSEKVRG